jgi:hypothetical protein
MKKAGALNLFNIDNAMDRIVIGVLQTRQVSVILKDRWHRNCPFFAFNIVRFFQCGLPTNFSPVDNATPRTPRQ